MLLCVLYIYIYTHIYICIHTYTTLLMFISTCPLRAQVSKGPGPFFHVEPLEGLSPLGKYATILTCLFSISSIRPS